MDFPSGSVVKNLPVMQESQVQSLAWEDPLEKEMEPGGLQSMGLQMSWTQHNTQRTPYMGSSISESASQDPGLWQQGVDQQSAGFPIKGMGLSRGCVFCFLVLMGSSSHSQSLRRVL